MRSRIRGAEERLEDYSSENVSLDHKKTLDKFLKNIPQW